MSHVRSDLSSALELRTVETNGVALNVAVAGAGPAVVLLHGFPHTWRVWSALIAPLAVRYRVIAPDLRGFGDSSRSADGYDAGTLARDIEGLLDALDVRTAAIVGIDAGTPVAVMVALRQPARVRQLAVMEALVGSLPGAEEFLAGGPPWWFGFHAVPDLAETVLAGNEAAYVDWFLHAGTRGRGVPTRIRDAVIDAFARPGALGAALAYYRALPQSARQIAEAFRNTRLTVPTMAIGAHPVGSALERQLRPLADDLIGHVIPDCGHIIPVDRPAELLDLLMPFLDGRRSAA